MASGPWQLYRRKTGPRSPRKIHDYSLDLLTGRAYTRRALEKKLASKQFEPAEIADELESLERAGLVDDQRFAREYARQKLTSGKSFRRVELELIHRGILPSLVRDAIETVKREEMIDVEKSLRAAAQKKVATLSGVEQMTARKRLFAYLARRGFEIDAVRRVVGDLIK